MDMYAAPRSTRFALWLKLLVLGVLAYIAASPFIFHFLAATIAQSGKPSPMPIAALVAFMGVQASVFVGLAAWAFVALGPQMGLDAPVLRGTQRLREVFVPAILAGTIATLVLVAISLGLRPFLPAELHKAGTDAANAMGGAWLGISGAFYGGIIEEMIMRLGLMTVLAFAFSKAHVPKAAALLSANFAAALLFGVGHLPAARALGIPFTPALIAYIVLANAVGGIVFGWLYAKRGIETAMLAHFTGDVWVHVALRSFLS